MKLFNLYKQNASPKTEYLMWYDIALLTAIFFGRAIFDSTREYINLMNHAVTVEENVSFSATDNYMALAYQAIMLLLGLLYLKARNFDFKVLRFRFTPKAVAAGVFLFIAAALMFDIYLIITQPLAIRLPFPMPKTLVSSTTVSLFIYSIFNGVYEELFFLGICLSVKQKDLAWALPVSLFIRFSFHTYQGMLNALGIGFMFGSFMVYMYCHSKKNLLPFCIAHSLGDIFGVGILYYIVSAFQ